MGPRVVTGVPQPAQPTMDLLEPDVRSIGEVWSEWIAAHSTWEFQWMTWIAAWASFGVVLVLLSVIVG